MTRLNPRSVAALAHDIAAAAVAWYLAYWLRFNTEIPEYIIPNMVSAMLWVTPLQTAIFFGSGMYRGIWRYASVADLQRIALAVGLSTLMIALVLLLLPHQEPPVPRSVILLDPILLILLLGGSRLGYRVWKERRLRNVLGSPGMPVVILGAGDAAADLLKNLARTGDWRVLGLFDDNPAKRGRQIQGVNVLGALEDLVGVAPRLGVERAIIAMPSASHQSRRHALEICRRAGVQALTVPSYQDLMSGKVTVSQVRNIELDDLLGRDPVLLDESRLQEWIRGRSILVTGAGGSIGSELCRQIARFEPARLVLYEHNEFALYRMEQEFAEQYPGIELNCVIGDVKNAARVAEALAAYRPQLVFHAAAYKHVPLMEEDNAWEAIQNNVLGTWRVAEAAIAHGVEKFVLVSTDKAVNPSQCDGREQAPGGNRLPGIAGRECDPLCRRALRQRAWQRRQRGPEIPRADRARRPDHRNASGDHALLHVDPGSGAAGAAGGIHGDGRGNIRARHGRTGQNRRSGARTHPAVRVRRGGHRHPIHRPAARRKTVRGTARRRRACPRHAASQAAHRQVARSAQCRLDAGTAHLAATGQPGSRTGAAGACRAPAGVQAASY